MNRPCPRKIDRGGQESRMNGHARSSLLPRNKFADANRSIVDFEIRPGRTVTFQSEVDLTQVVETRRSHQMRGLRPPSYTAFVAKAVALALREFPQANRRFARRAWLPTLGPRLQQFHRADVAVAVERDVAGAEGVAFVDIARDVDRMSLAELTGWLHQLATCDVTNNEQWRSFSEIVTRLPTWISTLLIRLPYFVPRFWDEFRGASVLISSPAKYGVDGVVGSWSWPLGVSFGLAKQRPVVRDGDVVPCWTFTLTLNFDRRIMAGAPAGRFFKRIVDLLEQAVTMEERREPTRGSLTAQRSP